MNGQSFEPSSIELTDDMVIQFLIANPNFFIRNASVIEHMQVPHPVRGSVSLVEWRLDRQRQQIQRLEDEITALMEHASANENLLGQFIALQRDIVSVESLQELLTLLHNWACSIGLAGAYIRLFSDKWRLSAPSGFTYLALERQVFEPIRIHRMQNGRSYLGTLNNQELRLLIPDVTYAGSVAMLMLGHDNDLGLIIFVSRNSQHYQHGMGTLLLDYLNTLLPGILSRWVETI